MTASTVILASCVTPLEVKTIIIGATETFYVFARLLMSVNQTKSFAIVQTVHLHNFSLGRVFYNFFLKLSCLAGKMVFSTKSRVGKANVQLMCYKLIPGAPNVNFRKMSVRQTNFQNICCKSSCLPASPRIFEHLKKNGIIAHF